MAKYTGMGNAIGLLGQALMRQAESEEARKAKEALLQEELQQRQDAVELNAQTLRMNAIEATRAKQAQIDVEREKHDWAPMLPGNRQAFAGHLALQGGFDPTAVRNALELAGGGQVPDDQRDAAMALAASEEFRKAYTMAYQPGTQYKAQREGVAQDNANTSYEQVFRKTKDIGQAADAARAATGAPRFVGGVNVSTGVGGQAYNDDLKANVRIGRAGGGQDLFQLYALKMALEDAKSGARSADVDFKTAHDAALKRNTRNGRLDGEGYLADMEQAGYPGGARSKANPPYRPGFGPGLLNSGSTLFGK